MEQKIKCNVESCKFQDHDNCHLKEIQVDCNCDPDEAKNSEDAICNSFECDEEKTDM